MSPEFLASAFYAANERVQEETVTAIVTYLRHAASGYGGVRTSKAHGAAEALYSVAKKLEKDWRSVVLQRETRKR